MLLAARSSGRGHQILHLRRGEPRVHPPGLLASADALRRPRHPSGDAFHLLFHACVCVYVRVCAYLYVHVYVCVCECTRVPVCLWVRACEGACVRSTRPAEMETFFFCLGVAHALFVVSAWYFLSFFGGRCLRVMFRGLCGFDLA